MLATSQWRRYLEFTKKMSFTGFNTIDMMLHLWVRLFYGSRYANIGTPRSSFTGPAWRHGKLTLTYSANPIPIPNPFLFLTLSYTSRVT